ncbi:MAG: DapH/DapD/GlmU-related protein [Bacteriovoracia bacterium]
MAKNSSRVATGLPSYAYLIIDLVSFLLSVGPGAIAFGATLLYLRHFWYSPLFPLYALLAVLPLVICFLLAVFCLRLLVPRLKKGVYPMAVNLGMFSWYCNLALSRAAQVSGLSPLLNSFYITKFLHWRALGMKIAFGVNTSIGVSFVDLPMIRVGKGCTISEGVHIACHTFVGDRLLIIPVEIGENVFIGMNCVIGPKTRLGDRAWIGMNNLISEGIPADAKLENFAWEHGNPERAPAKD